MNGRCRIDIEAESKPSCYRTNPGIAYCPECQSAMCPVCHRHNVTQLSRVTGYVSSVSGWNAGKRQELKDRKRYGIGRG